MLWYEKDSDTLLTNWTNPANTPMLIYGVSTTSGNVTEYDWDSNGGSVDVDFGNVTMTIFENGTFYLNDNGSLSNFPTLSDDPLNPTELGTVYYKVWDIGKNLTRLSDEASCLVNAAASLPVDTGGPVFTTLDPPAMTPDALIGTNITAYFDRNIEEGAGIVKLKVVGGADIESWTLPDDLGSGITILNNSLTLNPASDLANSTAVAIFIEDGAIKDENGYDFAGLTDDSVYFTTEASPLPPSQPLPPPSFSTWHFDDEAVDLATDWDTQVTVATWAAMVTAIQTAMADPGTVGTPKYHDIEYTGPEISGNQTISFTQSLPTEGSVYIRCRPTTEYLGITGRVTASTGVSDVQWVGWTFQADNNTHNGGSLTQSFRLGTAGKRFGFRNCRFGVYWRGITTPGAYAEAIGGTVANNKIWMKDCVGIRLHQVIDGRAGYYHMEGCLWLQLVDDVLAMTVRNAAPNVCGGYIARCIIADPVDDPAFSGLHPDGIQTGETSDVSTNTYYPEMHQTIFLGGTYRQYPTHAFFTQKGGPAQNFITKCTDNVLGPTGWRAIELSDKRTEVRRVMCVWPPTAGPIPNTGTGWTGGPPKPEIWLNANTTPGSSSTPIMDTILCSKLDDRTGWGLVPTGKVLYVNPTTPHTSTPSYASVFLHMPGMTFSGGQTRIDPVASGYRAAIDSLDMDTIRAWVSASYQPNSVAYGDGWIENGYTDPTTWR